MTTHTRGDLLSKNGVAVITNDLTFVGTGGVGLVLPIVKGATPIITANGTVSIKYAGLNFGATGIISNAGIFNVKPGGLKSGATAIIGTAGGLVSQNVDGQIIPIPFSRVNVSASMTGVVIPVNGTTASTPEFLVPRAGSLLRCAIRMSAAVGTGTLDVWPTVNGTTQTALKCHLNAATGSINQQVAAAQSKDVKALAQFDRVGMKITTSAGYLPLTRDLTGTVYIEI